MFPGSNLTTDTSTYPLDHSYTLSDDLGQIFDRGIGCDFTILINSPTGNKPENGTEEMAGKTICAHKVILSREPLFNATEESSITVNISQSCQPYFTSFIRFSTEGLSALICFKENISKVINVLSFNRYIYTRKIDVTFSSAECLHWLASQFGVKQLMEDVGRLFVKVLPGDASFHTQVSMYKYASESGDLILQESCAQYLAWNFQNLTLSPAWSQLPVALLKALLARSDLVVPDEYFLFQMVESWITQKNDSISSDIGADLLDHIRFPMVPAEKLYQMDSSPLFSAHRNLFYENMMKGFQFNVLLFTNLLSNPKFNREDDDFQPRIYTDKPWSMAVASSVQQVNQYSGYDPRYGSRHDALRVSYSPSRSLSTPVHNSLLFKDKKIQWDVTVFKNQYECSNRGVRCDSLPMARMYPQQSPQKNVLYRNRLLLKCQGSYIFHVQDFKDNQAYIRVNGSEAASYPCPDDKYAYVFVVRPEYV